MVYDCLPMNVLPANGFFHRGAVTFSIAFVEE